MKQGGILEFVFRNNHSSLRKMSPLCILQRFLSRKSPSSAQTSEDRHSSKILEVHQQCAGVCGCTFIYP